MEIFHGFLAWKKLVIVPFGGSFDFLEDDFLGVVFNRFVDGDAGDVGVLFDAEVLKKESIARGVFLLLFVILPMLVLVCFIGDISALADVSFAFAEKTYIVECQKMNLAVIE